jgi:Ca-activated chloride channel family protein
MKDEWKGLNLVELLDLLEPVPEPEPISMMPQTVGWLWLLLFLAALFVLFGRKLVKHRKENAYRNQALDELAQSSDDPTVLSNLIRRTALAAYPRYSVASLSGSDWLEFLDRSYGGKEFTSGHGQALASAPYRENSDAPNLKPLVKDWIRSHRRDFR